MNLREDLEEIESNCTPHIHKRAEVPAAWARVWRRLAELEIQEKLANGAGRRRDRL